MPSPEIEFLRDRTSAPSVTTKSGVAVSTRRSTAWLDRNSLPPGPLTPLGPIAGRWLSFLALCLFLVVGQKSFGQSITLAPPTSSTTYVDTLSVSYSITGDSSAQSVKVVWTYTSGNSTSSIGTAWTLTMKTPSLSQTFTLKPTDLTNSANAFTASPSTAMPEGFYSVYAQYTRPASAGSLLVTTTTRTNVYLDTQTQAPSFAFGTSASIDTTTDVVTLASHGLANNTPVTVTGTVTGTNFSAGTTYYVSVIDTNTFKLVTTSGGSTYVDFTTATSPGIIYPPTASGSKFPGTTATIQYRLPEFYLSGSAQLTFSGPTIVTVNLVDNVLNARFSFSRSSISNPTYIQSSSPTSLPDGTYTVTLSYQDRYSHPVATAVLTNITYDAGTQTPSFTSLTNNAVIVHGSTIPYTLPEAPLAGTVNLTFSNGTTTTVVPLADATSATFTFNRALYATTIPTGTYTVTLSYQDASGNPVATTAVTGIAVTVAPISKDEDSDGDGLNDAAEIALASFGFDWQVAQASLVTTFLNNAGLYTQAQMNANRVAGQADVTSNPTAYSLYSLSQLQNLQVGTPLIVKDTGTGKWKLTIALQKSTDLTNYSAFPFISSGTSINSSGQVEFLFTVPETNAFFRLTTP